MIKHKILKDIDELVENNLITKEQGSDIVNYYNTKTKPTFESSMLLPLIGVLLIGAGFIAMCASNWENMTDTLRLFIAFVPITLLSGALYNYKNSNSQVLVQCLAFGVAFALLFGFGIVANVYQTPIDTNILLHVCLFCVIPLVYVFDGYWLGVIALAFGLYSSSSDYTVISIIGLLSMLPYCYYRVREKLSLNMMIMLHVGVLFRTLYLIYPEFEIMYLGISTLLVLGLFFNNALYQSLLKIIIFVLGIVFSFSGSYYEITSNVEIIIMLIYILMIGFVVYYTYYNVVENKILNYQLSGILVVSIFYVIGIDNKEIFSLLMIYILIYNAYDNFKHFYLKGYNFYSFIFTGFILSKMFSFNLPFMTQGVVFIALGIAFIYLSQHVSKVIKAQRLIGGVENEEFTQ